MERARRLWDNYLELWKRLSGWKLFLFYMAHYTCLFIFLQYAVFSDFYAAEKSFIWQTDGLPSYFASWMVYISKTVRNGIQELLAGNSWLPPLYDYRRGVMKPIFEGEAIQWLAIFWPWDKIDVLYDVLVLVRYYLIGASFSLLGFFYKQKPIPVMIGAISYTFCGFSIYAGVRHPWFMAPMIFLPVLIIGAEKVLRGERAWLFSGIVFLSLISSLYFSCMIAILILIYIFVRYFCTYQKNGVRGFGCLIGRMALWGGLGILLSGMAWMPTLLQMFGTERIGRKADVILKYAGSYYQKFLTAFIVVPGEIGSWACLGFSVLAIPAVLLLVLDKRKEIKTLKIILLILTGMVWIPLASYVMSGFNTYSNRWIFGYALCVSVIIMTELPLLLAADRKELAAVGIGTVMYIILCRFVIERKYYYEEPQILLILALLIILMCYLAGSWGRRRILALCLLITCASVNYSATIMYAPSQYNYVSEFVNKGEAYGKLNAGQYTSLRRSERVQGDGTLFYVLGNAIHRAEISSSYYSGVNGLSFYSSSLYTPYRTLKNDLEVGQRYTVHTDYGLDGRSALMSLANVKYYALRETGTEIWPYGMKKIDRIKNGKNVDVILENKFALTPGYTYERYIDIQELMSLPPLQRQEAMLQAVVLDSETLPVNIPQAIELEKNAEKIPVKITCGEGVVWDDSKLTITKEGAEIKLSFDGKKGCDTYLRIIELTTPKRITLNVSTEDTKTATAFTPDDYVYAHGAKTQTVYLGYSPEGYTTCTLTFPIKESFMLENLEIWCQPMDHYAEQIEALRAEALENVETNWRGLTGTISVSKDKFLCFSIPYDEGWTAYVDGEKANIVQANIGFMGVELSTGDHDIELKYWPPGLTVGISLSCVGGIGVVALALWERKKKKV